jgi:hypothetical protein
LTFQEVTVLLGTKTMSDVDMHMMTGTDGGAAVEAEGFALPDFSDSDVEVEFVDHNVPGISLRVTLGASPMGADEEAILGAFLEERLGAKEAGEVEASLFTKALSLKYEASRTWPVLALQVGEPAVYKKLMRAFEGAPLASCEIYRGYRELSLGAVLMPSSQKKKKVTVAYVREGQEQYLPQAPPLGQFQGTGVLITLRIPNSLGLKLSHGHLNRLAGGLVMAGSRLAQSSDKGKGGGAWAHEAEGVLPQLARQGLQGEAVKMYDRASGQHKCPLQPWASSGSRLRGLHRGASMQVRVTLASGGGGGAADPAAALPRFLLAGEVGWALDAKPLTDDNKKWASKLCSVEMDVQVSAASGYTAVALVAPGGAKCWQVSPGESGPIPEGYAAAARPERAAKKKTPEFVEAAVKKALREAGNRHVEERHMGAVCGSFSGRAVTSLVKRTKGVPDWRAQLPSWCEEVLDPASSFGRLAVCPVGVCCQRRRFPCILFGGAEAAATAAALRQVLGGRGGS